MIEVRDIHWLAGLLEGEGAFGFKGTLRLGLEMADEDVVRKAQKIMRATYIRMRDRGPNRKKIWITTLYARRAAEWMMTLLPLMGKRRQKKIKACLKSWKRIGFAPKDRMHCPQGHPYDKENTYKWHAHRMCRTCQLRHAKIRYAKQRRQRKAARRVA